MRASGQKDYLSLIKGLNTETSALAFPESFTSDELNFVINKDGLIRKRRLGFQDLVTPFVITGGFAAVENVFYWRGPSLVCVTVTDDTPQTKLRFHAVDDDFTFIAEVTISSAVVKTQISETTNFLVITTDQGTNPVMCEYKELTKEIFVSSVKVNVRDFELVDDGLEISEQPINLSDNHKYNLFNADWHLTRADLEDNKTEKLVTTAFKDFTGVYPSNAQVASVGVIIDEGGDTVFSSKDVKGANFGNSKAGRGHYVYDINDFNRDAKLLNPEEDGAPSTTLVPIGTINFSGTPTYNPDEPDVIDPEDPDTPSGGGGIPPYKPPFDEFLDPE